MYAPRPTSRAKDDPTLLSLKYSVSDHLNFGCGLPIFASSCCSFLNILDQTFISKKKGAGDFTPQLLSLMRKMLDL